MEAKLYKINKRFAARSKLPMYFVAKELIQTTRAVYLYGHGTIDTVKMGVCCVCGRTLTHPVSVELGIGPECGRHYWDWDLVGGYTKENMARLMKTVQKDLIIDTWIPKTCLNEIMNTEETVDVPPAHPKLNGNGAKSTVHIPTVNKPARYATLSSYKKTGLPAIKIAFPYDPGDVLKVRGVPGRQYHSERKCWSAPASVEAVTMLQEWGFDIDPRLMELVGEKKKTMVHVDQVDEIEVPGLKGTLYPFQKKGVSYLEAHRGRALIGDEMGLGKTIQALAFLQLHPELRPVVIVCPAAVKLNWEREINAWMTAKYNVRILSGSIPTPFDTNYDHHHFYNHIFIINYDILSYWVDELKKLKPQVLITDECHYYKNNGAKRTKAVKKLGKQTPHVIALSGTPIVNRPIEIFNAVKIIDGTILPNYWEFAKQYCGAKHNGYGWDFTGATNKEELHQKLTNSVMIRRLKKDVLPELPDKVRSFVPIELDNQKEYNAAQFNFIEFVRRQKGENAAERASNAAALAEIELLKQLAVKGKLKAAIGWIRDFLESDEKLVVFATHKFVIEALMEEFKEKAVKVDGSVTGFKRQEAVDIFQTNPFVQLFVGNIKAAGIGITLTAASNVAFLELPWTPGELVQAEDRVHRIGQENSVSIHYLLANNTIEEKIAVMLDKKRKVLDAVLDGKETEDESLLSLLMNEYE